VNEPGGNQAETEPEFEDHGVAGAAGVKGRDIEVES